MPTLAPKYLALKASLSRRLAEKGAGLRLPVPVFKSPELASDYLVKHLRWTGDKWWLDAYHHPEQLQASFVTGTQPEYVDCDDFACWAYASLVQLPGYQVQIWTVLDFWLAASHVVCTYRAPDGACGVLSNGHHRPLEGDQALDVLQAVAEEFKAYRWRSWWPAPRFTEAVATPYPFGSLR